MLAITRAPRTSAAGAGAVVLADQGQQALAGDDAHPHAELVEDDQRRGRERQNPEQLVAVLGAEDRVGGDPGRVVVGEPGQDPRADDGEQSGNCAAAQRSGVGAAADASADGGPGCVDTAGVAACWVRGPGVQVGEASPKQRRIGCIIQRERAGFMKRRVVIVGGGVAGLEALMALHDLAGDRAELTLVAPDPDFLYKPLLVEEPFDLGPAERHALGPLVEVLGGDFVQEAVTRVKPDEHTVELTDGARLEYDFLIVCAGGRFRPALEGARTFPSGGEPLRINDLLRAGEGPRRIAFVVPPGVTWALPIYELALHGTTEGPRARTR